MKVYLKSLFIIGLALVNVLTSFALEKAADGYYLIKDAEDLVEYRDGVNKGKAMNGRLTADIDLSTVCGPKNSWKPINSQKLAIKFDGGHHSVSNLYIHSQEDGQGLFYCVDYLHDLIVKSAYVKGGDYVGGIVGCGSGSDGKMVIDNCHFKGDVAGKQYVGGILGGKDMQEANVFNCSNYGLIVGHDHVGGIIGYALECMISNCYNVGRLKAYPVYDGQYYTYQGIVGGIVGYYGGNVGNSKYYCINACFNYAVLSGIGIGNIVGERGGQTKYLIQACAALIDINPESDYENNVTFMSATSCKIGILKKHLNNYRVNRPDYDGLFGLKLELLAFEQTTNVDLYPHLPDVTFSPSKEYAVNYRGDFNDVDIFTSNMKLPVCDNDLFHYEFSNNFKGKNVVSDTVVIVKRVLNQDFLPMDKDGYYLISDAFELGLFRDAVNSGAHDINGRLTKNIDLSDSGEWEPIGSRDICCTEAFSGVFDGDGYSISGITENKDFGYAGLFSHIKNAEVKNVILRNSTFEGYYAGSICAFAESSLIINCGSDATIIGHHREAAAGFIAVANDCKVINCYNLGSVTGEGKASGFIAVLRPDCLVENCYASCTVANSGEGWLKTPFAFEHMNTNVRDCYYNGTLCKVEEETLIHENVLSLNTKQMKSESFVEALNQKVEKMNAEQDTLELRKWVLDETTGYPKNSAQASVGIEDLMNEGMSSSWMVYTVKDQLYIISEKKGVATLYNHVGQAVRQIRYEEGENQVYGLMPGVYVLKGNKFIIR